VTILDIARKAGVSKSTVSYALRDDPNICKATRLRIREVADRLGYRPDPLVAKLMSHLHKGASKRQAGVLAFVNLTETRDFRSAQPVLTTFVEGAARRADALGYKLESFWFHEPGLSANRLAQIFRNRGIKGLLLGSTAHPGSRVEFPWEDFSVITVGYSIAQPLLHRVVTHHYRNSMLGIRKAVEAGCRRLGFIINKAQDSYMDDLHAAAVYSFQAGIPKSDRVRPLILKDLAPRSLEAIRPWFCQNHPDVLLCAGVNLAHVRDAGVEVPAEVPGMELLMSHARPDVAGLNPRYDLLGGMAINLLATHLQHDEVGVPEVPVILQVEGCWHPGSSFPASKNKMESERFRKPPVATGGRGLILPA
jgi:DNA-binding LacI/PurR family transcriptional regulator